MFIVNLIWDWHKEDKEDLFSYDSFSSAIKETEKFLSGVIKVPAAIYIYDA